VGVVVIPLLFTVGHRAYSDSGEDAHGNPAEDYADPVDVEAIWWSPSSSEPALAGHDRVAIDLVVVVSSATPVGPHDSLVVEGREYEVVGYPEDYDHGPWWSPNRKPVNVRRVEG
jgi:hypothetical protein